MQFTLLRILAITVFQTTSDLKNQLTNLKDINFSSQSHNGIPQIVINTSIQYQQIDGIGASLTDAATWLLAKKLNQTQLEVTLSELFDPDAGIGLSFLRQPMAASDLSVTFFSYDDLCAQTNQPCTSRNASDVPLSHFSVAHDQEYILPLLRSALRINPEIQVMLSPWSPPGWMKSTGNMDGYDQEIWTNSSLLPQYYSTFAKYHARAVREYMNAGVPIFGLTVQNEPMWLPPMSVGMWMLPQDQLVFIRDHLAPELKSQQIDTKIMIYDWNWGDRPEYPEIELTDPIVYDSVAGISWHRYAGNATQMTVMHNRFPGKDQWMTEGSGSVGQVGETLTLIGKNLTDCLRNWSKSYVTWAMVTDQTQGPHTSGGCNDCRGLLTINIQNTSNISIQHEFEYYALGQLSKFLRYGARRIASSEPLDTDYGQLVQNVAFKNLDGSIVLYVVNSDVIDHEFEIAFEGRYALISLPKTSITTYIWVAENNQ